MTTHALPASPYPWRFFRAGGFDQVLLDSAEDLLALASLDQKLWVALSCPVGGVDFDRRTLELLDADQDGHIRAPEILAALAWLRSRLHDATALLKGSEALALAAVEEGTEEGRRVLSAARTILANLGKEGEQYITVEDASDMGKIFANARFNGDGVITVAVTSDEVLQAWIETLLDCLGGEVDRSGSLGITQKEVEQFAAEASAWLVWQSQTARNLHIALPPERREEVLELWDCVKEKIDDFFLRCSLAAYDSRAMTSLCSSAAHFEALANKNLARAGEEIAALPLALLNAEQVLNLEQGLNPAWAERMIQFRQEIVQPLLGPAACLSYEDWRYIKMSMAPYDAWLQDQIETPVAKLGATRLQAWVDSDVETSLKALIEQDLALKPEVDSIIEVEKLTRFCRDLYPLINNFVSFREFYTRRGKAIFQAGKLYLDGRCCELCVRVTDMAKHALLASLSRLFLIYCECVRKGGSEKIMIAAAMTDGDSDQLMVGRNGLFYDSTGQDWDATIVRIIDHPISVRQAFWAPYTRIGRMVSEQIQKLAAARTKATEEAALTGVTQTVKKEDAKPALPPAFDVGKFAGIFAAIGLAVGAIGTAVASILTGFLRLNWWQIPIALIGIILIISGPSMLMAWFKLRQRNLGPLLDANGWAINARARLNIPFGAALTHMSTLPQGAKLLISDPFAEKGKPWKAYLALIILLAVLAFVLVLNWFH